MTMKKPPRMTLSMGTDTSEGFIRHKLLTLSGVTFEAPVLLQTFHEDDYGKTLLTANVNGERLPIPRRIDKRLTYAMPGGNVYLQD